MTCEETRILVHALIDGELDAGHAREVESHLASCPACAAQLRDYRVMRQSLAAPALRHQAPAALRARIEAALPAPAQPPRAAPAPSRRSLLKGMAMGSVLSGALAASLAVFVLRRRGGSAHPGRRGVGASALAAGRPPDRRAVERSAYRQALVQRPARRGAAGDRPHRARLHADRRPARLYRRPAGRRHRLQAARPCDQSVRRAGRRRRRCRRSAAPASSRCRASTSGTGPAPTSASGRSSDINAEELQEFGDKLEAAIRGGA